MAKIQPCERIIQFTLGAVSGGQILDVMQALAMQNRKMYRQCMEVGIETVEVYGSDNTGSGYVDVHRIPSTWVTANAIVKARAKWLEQQNEILEETDGWSARAKYRDFKIYYNAKHADGTLPSLYPDGYLSLPDAQAIDSGAQYDWDHSDVILPNFGGTPGNTVEMPLTAIGEDDGGNSSSVVVAYAESRARPHPIDPSVVAEAGSSYLEGGLYTEMEDLGEQAEPLQDNIRFENSSPPYIIGGVDSQFEFYPGGGNNPAPAAPGRLQGTLQDRLLLRSGTALATDQTGPFSAYLGLLHFTNAFFVGEVLTPLMVRVKVMAGTYNGIAARDMGDVN